MRVVLSCGASGPQLWCEWSGASSPQNVLGTARPGVFRAEDHSHLPTGASGPVFIIYLLLYDPIITHVLSPLALAPVQRFMVVPLVGTI